MNFPVWDVPIGLPPLIAFVAIIHVVIAHFAIGGGLFLVVYERSALKRGDGELLSYVRGHSRFFMILTLVFGALTGVWIWFTIGLISPAGTSALIRLFLWFWATEWVMFFVEIAASLVYFYGWDRLAPKIHQRVMWIYFITAWGSLVVINGIITFMLTPGDWLQTRSIWDGFFNPTYLPSLVARTLISFLMAGLFAFLTASGLKNLRMKSRVLRTASYWTLPSLIVLIPVMIWYHSSLPESVIRQIAGGWTALNNASHVFVWSAAILAVGVVFSPLLRPRGMNLAEAVLLLLAGVSLFGSFEWYREAARKPFVISGYMYSDGQLAAATAGAETTATPVEAAKWISEDKSKRGRDIFRALCGSCHSLTGYNGLVEAAALRGWTAAQLAELIPLTEHMNAPMPPFPGSADEAQSIAGYITSAAKDLKIKKTVPDSGKRIWQRSCGLCHTIDGNRPLRDAFADFSRGEIKETILFSGDLSDAMPSFPGDEGDAETLAGYIEQRLTENPRGENR